MRLVLVGLGVLITACGGGGDVTAPVATTKQLQVINYLVTPVVITVDGVRQGAVSAGATTTLTIAGSAQTVSYAPSAFQYGDGSFVPNDLAGGSFALGNTSGTLGVNNLVGTQPYIAFSVFNASTATVYIGLSENGAVRCLGFLPVSGTQRYGYYVLGSTTEVREYTGSSCAGTFKAWTNAQLGAYEINSGYLALRAT